MALIQGADVRQAIDLAIAGAIGAICGLYLDVELVQAESVWARDALAGAILGGSIGFALNAALPGRDGAWLAAARASTWGTIAGALGGAAGLLLGEFALGGFQGGLLGRATSWAILGLGIGASQGLAHRSNQKLKFGLIGGGLGGFAGGAVFEQIRSAFGNRYDLGQGLGVVALGGGLGLALALVEQALRKAWVRVVRGRQEGRSYLLARDRCALGLDERAEVGLFGDPGVARRHAEIEASGGRYQLRNLAPTGRTTRVNGRDLAEAATCPLEDGDTIELGRTLVVFRRR